MVRRINKLKKLPMAVETEAREKINMVVQRSPMIKSKKMIVVLGPHRSGTSLCTAGIEALGAETCIKDNYRNEENPKGFFEHIEIVDFNNKLLSFLGGSWDNPLFWSAEVLKEKDTSKWKSQAVAMILNLFNDEPVVVIKDPRICQLLDFWRFVFECCGYLPENIYFVHVLRHPAEVALSQAKRVAANEIFYEIGREIQEGAALWLSLTIQALVGSRECQNYILSYRALVEEPDKVLGKLSGFLGLLPDQDCVKTFCRDFADKRLYRSKDRGNADSIVSLNLPQAIELYTELEGLLDDGLFKEKGLGAALTDFESKDLREALIQSVVPALSRLSEACRKERSAREQEKIQISIFSGQLEDLSADRDRIREDLENENKRIESEYKEVVETLRSRALELEEGNTSLQGQLEDLSADRDRIREDLENENKRIESEYKEVVETLHSRALELEEENTQHQDHLKLIRKTISWKITAPLKQARQIQIGMKIWFMDFLIQFKIFSYGVHDKVNRRFPNAGLFFRKLLRPFYSPIKIPVEYHTKKFQTQLEDTVAFKPLISVIVPNYNHSKFLDQRLESIYCQTYDRFEVILMDDCSTDDSIEVLDAYKERYPDKTRLIKNDQNSGGVFYQWEKGIDQASGEIIWVAESDDFCSNNFLETLVPFFHDEAVTLAYAKTVFVEKTGKEQIWSINQYLNDIDPDFWNHAFVETAHRIVNKAFAIKNIIPNVSSALFRKPVQLEILKSVEWKKMRTCGDWLLYLHLIRGGQVAYSPDAINFYRFHGENTSVSSYCEDVFYKEHEMVAKTVGQYFRVDPAVFDRQRNNLMKHWKENRTDFTKEKFNACYSIERIFKETPPRKPNLLMAGYGFFAGGGETFPIQLANLMKARDYNVTFLDCGQVPRLDGIRQSLRNDIPVVADLPNLNGIVANYGIEIIHSHHAWVDNTVLDLLPEDMSCKTIVTLHGMYETIDDHALKKILPRLVKRSRALVYTAKKNLTALTKHGFLEKVPLARIDNALDIFPFEKKDRAEMGVPDDAFLLTVVSRAIPDKGWIEAIEAVSLAREKTGQNIHLVLIGEGPVYDKLMRKGVASFVHLEGFQKNIRGYYAVSQMGFLPSRFKGESFPLVVIDCLHAGCPVLASSLGEIPYMLETESGPAGDLFDLDNWEIPISELADRIARLVVDKEFFQSRCDNVELAADKFDPVLLSENYDAVYLNAVSPSKTRKEKD